MTFAARDVSMGTLVLPREGDDVGEVVLAARVAIVDRLEPAGEVLRGRRHHAGVDLADRALLRRRVLVLDDRLHRALGVADDAPVAGRVLELDRQQRKRALTCMPDDRFERFRPRERVGAEQHERHAVAGQLRQRLREGVPGAERRILQRPAKIGLGKTLAHRVAAMTVDDADAVRRELARRLEHVSEQRPAAQRMQHLGQAGAHALAHTGGKDRDVEG